jgi:hypothetical protein
MKKQRIKITATSPMIDMVFIVSRYRACATLKRIKAMHMSQRKRFRGELKVTSEIVMA